MKPKYRCLLVSYVALQVARFQSTLLLSEPTLSERIVPQKVQFALCFAIVINWRYLVLKVEAMWFILSWLTSCSSQKYITPKKTNLSLESLMIVLSIESNLNKKVLVLEFMELYLQQFVKKKVWKRKVNKIALSNSETSFFPTEIGIKQGKKDYLVNKNNIWLFC